MAMTPAQTSESNGHALQCLLSHSVIVFMKQYYMGLRVLSTDEIYFTG
jgi:hypothetical protein